MASISIILCFYNAGKKLLPTLQHIKALDISAVDYCELLLINNNSNDNSDLIINQELANFTAIPWKIVSEPKPGLSNARLKGIAESTCDYLLFCDDDNWLAQDYIQKAIEILNQNKNIAVLGGLGTAISEVELPIWFKQYQNFYAVGKQMPQNGKVIGERNVVYGAGMIVNRKAWDYITAQGFSFFTLGRTGTKLSSGEDSELCLAFQIAGYDIWYNNLLCFKHYIEPHRLTLEYITKLQQGMNSSGYVTQFYRRFLFGYSPRITKYFWLKEFVYVLKDLIKGLFVHATKLEMKRNFDFALYLLRERNNYNQNVRKVLRICESLSKRVTE